MTRTHLWQLGAIAAAAGLICVAQAQTSDTSANNQAAAESAMADPFAAPEKWSDTSPTEADVQAVLEADATSTTTDANAPAEPSSEPATAAMPSRKSNHAVVVTPSAAPAAEAAPVAAIEPPITREEVIAEAVYANRHGLIPRGEMAMVDEDKGTQWAEKADVARIARAEQTRLARLETQQRLAQAAQPSSDTTASTTAGPMASTTISSAPSDSTSPAQQTAQR
ncbi:hypothetical protein [Aquabacterium sp.]|uniref:hypothetical protein n=1 Tax=Aquabacterium sp. TaxID=1872578 RepID=UPI002CD552F5|nr:hypothetical protein [Aquabacterium sp.]HSW07259.1 hypothetical protein [Aquabacterium sp.]